MREVWQEYLTSKHGQFAANAGTPSPLWSGAEQAQWPMYDLAGFYVPELAVPEVVSVTPVDSTSDSLYRIVTRFRRDGSSSAGAASEPALTMTVFARRDGARYTLANALPFLTAVWRRETRGRIRYHVAPALRFDSTRARRAAAFVDSLAGAFRVTAPARIDYYVAESVDQALEKLGGAMPQRFGAAGGFSKPVNGQVFSGIPALGEDYRHELVHVVLMPIIRDGSTSLIASEGVATWFGGTGGRDYRSSVRHLATLLREQPQLTLGRIADDSTITSDIRYAAGAVLAEMVHTAGGVEAVKAYVHAPGLAVRTELVRLLARPWSAIAVDWRRRVDQIAGE